MTTSCTSSYAYATRCLKEGILMRTKRFRFGKPNESSQSYPLAKPQVFAVVIKSPRLKN